MFTPDLLKKAETLLQALREKNMKLTTAESCTGGLVSALLTEIPGSSDVFTHGYVTYANVAKTSMLGVPADLIAWHGAVSAQVALAMAQGALKTSGADIAVAITGIAGPGGATEGKPVGLVHIACARVGVTPIQSRHEFKGTRAEVRLQALAKALELVAQQLTR